MTAQPSRRTRPTWVTVTVAALFGLFFAFLVWSAVDLLIQQAAGPLGLNGLGWSVHLLPVIFPMVAFGVAFGLGWRRPLGAFALILAAGLGVAAVFWVNILAYAVTSFALYGG
ncbi:bacitracin resistance protein [Microbacterium sp. RD1]|uniref:bacitracin resistance protein n=1 Tax=Microbacterium sp. RD1 TaxID=3457313 RepID=UPI003FA580C6